MNSSLDNFAFAEIGSLGMIFEPIINVQLHTERNIAMHMHMVYEMYLLLEGKARIATDSENYELEAGEVALILPQVYHSITNVTNTFQLFSVSFQLYKVSDPKNYEEEQLQYILETLNTSRVVLLKKQPEIIRIFQVLMQAQKTQGLANSYLVNAYVTEFLIYLFRALPPTSELYSKDINKSNRQTKKIQLDRRSIIENYIAAHYADGNISELANQMALSEQHIRRFLRNYYGMSFSQLLNKHRINVSKHLLQNTDKRISEIWELVGFNSAQNFSVAFKKFVGVSASEYRKKHFS